MEENNKFTLPNNPYARATPFTPIVRVLPKVGRNAFCPFENKKFKNCCGKSGQNFCTKAKENLENHISELRAQKTEQNNDQSG